MNLDVNGQRVGVWAVQTEDASWAGPQCAKNLPALPRPQSRPRPRRPRSGRTKMYRSTGAAKVSTGVSFAPRVMHHVSRLRRVS